MSIRSILVPLDGSELSEQAITFATTLARSSRASIRLLSVVPDPFVLDPGLLPAPFAEEIARAHVAVEEYVDGVVERFSASSGVRISGEVALGAPADCIVEAIRRTGADLVVMTSHGRGGFTRFWLGSVTDAVVRRATVPVLVIKSDKPQPTSSGLHLVSGVLVPLDGSPLAEIAIEPAVQMAKVLDAPIKLLLVLENPLHMSPGFAPYSLQYEPVVAFAQKEQAERYLEGVANGIRARGFFVDVATSDRLGVAGAIVDFEREHVHGLIVLATNARGGWKRLAIGSVADKVMRHAECPVLLVRPADAPPRLGDDRHPAWQRELAAFTQRNAGRPVRIEIDVASLGAQREVEGLELSGVYYDPREDRFGVTVRGNGGTHLTHSIGVPSRIDLLESETSEVLAVRHGGGQTRVLCMIPARRTASQVRRPAVDTAGRQRATAQREVQEHENSR